jgi:transcription elongation factor Elf1
MAKKKSVELLPCPFCGHSSPTSAAIDSGKDSAWEVNCGQCQGYTWGATQAEAEAAWNRRVP